MPESTPRVAVAVVGLLVIAGAVVAPIARNLIMSQVEELSLHVVSLNAGTRSAGEFDGGRVRTSLVLEVVGAPLVASQVRAALLDIAIESMPIGRAIVLPDPDAGAEGPVRFHVELEAEFRSADALAIIHHRAIQERGGEVLVEARGVLYMPLGVERPVEVRAFAPMKIDPLTGDDVAVFGGAIPVRR